MQHLIIILAVGASLVYIGLRLRATFRGTGKTTCGCSCAGCGSDSAGKPAKIVPFPQPPGARR